MSKFKVGDKVREKYVIGSDKSYEVQDVLNSGFFKLIGIASTLNPNLFELVEPAASNPGVVYEIGKTYSFLNSVRTCIAFTSKGLPVFEREDGTVFEKDGGVDFKEVVKLRTGKSYVNVYDDFNAVGHSSRNKADKSAGSNRVACVEVNWTEGEGL